MRLLVTGASGFVGGAVIGLAAQREIQTRALVRSQEVPLASESVQVEDLRGEADWASALEGVDAVIHLAARVHVMRDHAADPLAEFRAVNLEGTRRLAEAAADAGVGRFVFVSTVKVHGELTGAAPFKAESPLRAEEPYARSKAEAEIALREIEARRGLEVVIVRPPLVYGPGVRGNFLSLLRAVYRGLPLPFGSIRNRRSLIYVQNLADLLLLAAGSGVAPGHSFLASDAAPMSTPQLVRELARALGKRPRLIPLPLTLLRATGLIAGRRAAVNRLIGSLEVDAMDTGRALSWEPLMSTEEGLLRTAEWYRKKVRQ
jgi:nucleoside-diphosphate-sugar epimerase